MSNKIPEPSLTAHHVAQSHDPVAAAGSRADISSPPQQTWVKLLVWVFLLGGGFGAGWMMSTASHEHHEKDVLPPGSTAAARDSSAVVVTVEPVGRHPVQRTVEAFGTMHGFEEVSISARVEGRVRQILHDVADHVKPAELMLEIESTDYDLAVQQADRGLQVELAKLGLKEPPGPRLDLGKIPVVVKALSLMEHAKSRHDRLGRLAASKTVSAEDSESAASEYRTSQAEYDNQIIQAESSLATIQMKQVELAVAREKLANTKVFVPTPTVALPGNEEVDYVISERSVAEGTLVRPGTEIFKVIINQTLKLRVPVPERYSAEIRLGQKADIFAATSSTPFAGTVSRIYPTVEPTTRTFQVEIQVPNRHGDLKPGSFAKAAILTRFDPEAVTVPLSALIQFAGITKIFLAENGRAKEIPVVLGTQTTEWVEISRPLLPPGSQVITSGQTAIASETAVVVRDSVAMSDAPVAAPATGVDKPAAGGESR
jgi:RND family efflux transporter MFP subunit